LSIRSGRTRLFVENKHYTKGKEVTPVSVILEQSERPSRKSRISGLFRRIRGSTVQPEVLEASDPEADGLRFSAKDYQARMARHDMRANAKKNLPPPRRRPPRAHAAA
jgi:hypothetical protein